MHSRAEAGTRRGTRRIPATRVPGPLAAFAFAVALVASAVPPAAAAAAPAGTVNPASPGGPLGTRDALRFPRAHGAHPGAALEWWYVTAILEGPEGLRIGSELTFFRARVAGRADGASAWQPGDLYFAHFAVSDLARRRFVHDERAGRTGVALAGADSTGLDVWIRDWSLRREPDGSFRLHAAGEPGSLTLTLAPERRPPVAWGPGYVSYKDSSRTSFSRYQSFPRMRATGSFARPGDPPRDVRGQAWFDHEWSDGRRAPGIAGWDWMGLRIGDGRSLMLYRMRSTDGRTAHLSGGLVGRDGRVVGLRAGEVRLRPLRYWVSRRSGARYPIAWRVRVTPRTGSPIELTVSAPLEDQELTTPRSTGVTYWEGVVEGSAREDDRAERVEGYLELTGYAGGGAPGALSTSGPPDR